MIQPHPIFISKNALDIDNSIYFKNILNLAYFVKLYITFVGQY